MKTYELFVDLSNERAKELEGKRIIVTNPPGGAEALALDIQEVEEIPLQGFKIPLNEISKLKNALIVPLSDSASRRRVWQTLLVYVFLSPSRISTFFIRGWRLDIIRNMILSTQKVTGIAPTVNRLSNIGGNIKQGAVLIGLKLVYDLPKILILTAVGYHYIEFILDWLTFIFGNAIGSSSATFDSMIDDTQFKVSLAFSFQVLFILIYSFFVTPMFKINEIKYAKGNIELKDFFKAEEIIDSYKKYKKYKMSTLQVYIWDLLVTGASWFFGFFLVIFFPWLYFIINPLYKLLFKHWPKAYGYGLLGKKMEANGDI
ncbi:hypothetical protein [Lewinella cohaerens]|uniref:hypothetical protein n=1 Tax=Lewinella cohaerens TaxID=70995 RepID=UPI000368CBFD|nr:hypothetical protein [Lewinella cohaerens]